MNFFGITLDPATAMVVVPLLLSFVLQVATALHIQGTWVPLLSSLLNVFGVISGSSSVAVQQSPAVSPLDGIPAAAAPILLPNNPILNDILTEIQNVKNLIVPVPKSSTPAPK